MADLNVRDEIHHDRETVYETFRDDLVELVDYLPNIREIEVDSYEQVDENTVEIVNIWKATERDIPSAAQQFIDSEMLQWHDYATWKQDQWVCEWEMEVDFMKDAVTCTGENRYREVGDGKTAIEIDGTLEVDAGEIPGVPGLLAGKVGDAVENFVVKLIEPNLTDVNRGLEEYLDAQEQ
ncbi:MAG: DUF2505 family protein [Bradymonadaceae bacterium]